MDMDMEWRGGLWTMVSFAVVYVIDVIDLWCAIRISCVGA